MRFLGYVLFLGTLFGVGCGEEAPAAAPEFSVHSAGVKQGLLLSVLEHQGTVWTVGGRSGTPFVAHIKGDRLFPVKAPGTSTAWWVCGLGQQVAVVGDKGLILLQKGKGFEQLDLGIQSTLYGCAGESLDDFWVVGGNPQSGPPELVHVVDGVGRAPDLALDIASLPKVFYKVARFGDSVVVVGEDGLVLIGDVSGAWSLENIGEDEPLFTVSGNSVKDFWVVGGRVDALAYHYDGRRFSKESPKFTPGLFGVAVSGERVLAVGYRGLILERKNDEWERLPPLSQDTLHAVWQNETGHAWAVGGNVLASSDEAWRGVVFER